MATIVVTTAVLGAILVVALAAVGAWRRRAADRRLARAAAAATSWDEGLAEGRLVRVRGQVLRADASGFTGVGGRRRSIMVASYLGDVQGLFGIRTRGRWEQHGTDFVVALDGGREVGVRIAGATWLRRPAADVYAEQTIAPGDRVEVVGVVAHEADPAAPVRHWRDPRLRTVLASAPGAPVIVRAV